MTKNPPRILAFADNVVDCYRDRNVMYPGGNCVNHAVFARRFGAVTAYAGAVADDEAGRAIRAALRAEGVDTSLLRLLPGETAYCVIATENGDRVFVGANLGVSIVPPSDADLAWMATADAVHTGRSSHIDAWLGKIATLTRVSYDFATMHGEMKIAAVAPHCFLAAFSGGDLDREAAAALARTALSHGATWAVVTRGENGALLMGPDSVHEAGGEKVVPIDTLGAGDTFIARVLVGLLREEAPSQLMKEAALAAAETCLSPGAFGHGVPMDIDLTRMMTIDEIYATTTPAPPPGMMAG